MEVEHLIDMLGYLVNCIVCLPNYWLLLVFIAGLRSRELFGPSLTYRKDANQTTLRTEVGLTYIIYVNQTTPQWTRFGKLLGHVT